MKITDRLTVTNEDCMELMGRYPDGYFDLAIVDPPYGIGETAKRSTVKRKTDKWKNPKAKDYTIKQWDKSAPDYSYFIELTRVSKHQIIWGANHFIERIPSANSSCWIVWDKKNGDNDFADCELAWSNMSGAVRKFEYLWNGFQKQSPEDRFHPTQKPVALYKWLLDRYAKPIQAKLDRPMRILDTHLGSGSIAIACHDYGYDLTACELDPDYYKAAIKRIQNHTAQTKLF